MPHVFISYARSTAKEAQTVAGALRGLGHDVWLDDEIPAHRAYADVIEERLREAKAVVVIWSADAVKSQWVQSEADRAREDGLNIDGAKLPMPFDRIECVDMSGWAGDPDAPGWKKVTNSVAELAGARAAGARPAPTTRELSICVLPFVNMSGDPEQEYFSDGISEDIITDLSKVKALEVCARNTAFTFKGRSVRAPDLARELGVTHVLEGSVRRAGGRVRITAQLIDGATGNHAWADRWDRDLTDIFALQDEISHAVVAALKVRLLPEEREAIARRGTTSAEAYDLYLMARQHLDSGNTGDVRAADAILSLCRRATEIDPDYAAAWALVAVAQTELRLPSGKPDDGLAEAERALGLDPDLADAHAVRARHLFRQGHKHEASAEIELALRLDPDSYEVNSSAALLSFRQQRFEDSISYYEKAAGLIEANFGAPGMLITCYVAIGDIVGVRRAARMCLARVQRALAQDRSNGTAMGFGVAALAALGEADQARDWSRRALLIDPENMSLRYNLLCSLSGLLKDTDAALDLLGPYFAAAAVGDLSHIKVDPDLDPIREDRRFQAMLAAAEARLAAADGANSSSA